MNSALSVIHNQPGSHLKLWTKFTDSVIEFISNNNDNCVFLLLGNFAKNKNKFIKNIDKIIYGIHPSPLARGFIGSDVFKNVEKKLGYTIDWKN